MKISTKAWLYRALDALLLALVYIFQSVILSQYTVYSQANAELPNHYVNPVRQKILWLIGDLICLVGFLLTSFFGFRHLKRTKEKRRIDDGGRTPQSSLRRGGGDSENGGAKGGRGDAEVDFGAGTATENAAGAGTDDDVNEEEQTSKKTLLTLIIWFLSSSKIPLCYISWFIYAMLLMLKVSVVFTSDISEHMKQQILNKETIWFNWQLLQLAIGLTAIIFSLLVEAHHDAGKEDPKRKEYLNSVSYGVALEILDTSDLLVFLMPTFEHQERHQGGDLTVCPVDQLTPLILTLATLNLILPTLTLYKLTNSNFGEIYQGKLELIYNTLHLVLVNVPYLIVRAYLWNASDKDDVIFLIKNVYGIVAYFRDLSSEIEILRDEWRQKKDRSRSSNKRNVDGSDDKTADVVEMKVLM